MHDWPLCIHWLLLDRKLGCQHIAHHFWKLLQKKTEMARIENLKGPSVVHCKAEEEEEEGSTKISVSPVYPTLGFHLALSPSLPLSLPHTARYLTWHIDRDIHMV